MKEQRHRFPVGLMAREGVNLAIKAWVGEKDRSGDAAARNYPREVARWAAFLIHGSIALQANSSRTPNETELDDSRRALLAATRSDVVGYRDFLKEKRKPNGIRTVLSILGSFSSYLERNQYTISSPFAGLSRPRREFTGPCAGGQGLGGRHDEQQAF